MFKKTFTVFGIAAAVIIFLDNIQAIKSNNNITEESVKTVNNLTILSINKYSTEQEKRYCFNGRKTNSSDKKTKEPEERCRLIEEKMERIEEDILEIGKRHQQEKHACLIERTKEPEERCRLIEEKMERIEEDILKIEERYRQRKKGIQAIQ